MAKTKVSEWSTTPSSNTDIDGINIAENCPPSGINDAIRDMMAQIRSWQSGTYGDTFNGPVNGTIGATTASTGAFTTISASGNVTLSGGTANGVAYLNGSKVVTSGSALTFDGTSLGMGNPTVYGTRSLNSYTGTTASAVGFSQQISGFGNIWVGSNNSGSAVLGMATGTFGQSTPNNIPWTISAYGSEQMRLTSTGLGIGTSSPAYKLDVVGNAIQITSGAGQKVRLIDNTVQLLNSSAIASGVLSFKQADGTQKAAIGSYYNVADEGDLEFIGPTGSTNMLLNSSGNLGLGVTPSAWVSSSKALQINTRATLAGDTTFGTNLTDNLYIAAGPVFKYLTTAAGTVYLQNSGSHQWYNAPSGTAGTNATVTQALTLNASGNLILGGTTERSSAKFTVDFSGGSNNGLVLNNVSGGGSPAHISFQFSSSAVGSVTCTNTTTTYNITSDKRLKNDLGAVTTTDVIANTVIHDFTWKSDGSKSRGVFAQEAAKTLPSAVKVGDDGEQVTDQWQVDYSKYVPDIIVELQALRARVAELESK
jgi:hypothetical protein